MSRSMAALLALLAGASGCAGLPRAAKLDTGPKVEPDDDRWRRDPIPAPPFYMRWTSGSGQEWTMVTPLYWQAVGRERSTRVLFPFFSTSSDDATGASSGHALLGFWGRKGEDDGWTVVFPFYWDFEEEGDRTVLAGPVYSASETGPDGAWRERTVVFPWLYSRETDHTGYSYWGVFFRLFGYEKQVFDGEEKERMWLFFLFPISLD